MNELTLNRGSVILSGMERTLTPLPVLLIALTLLAGCASTPQSARPDETRDRIVAAAKELQQMDAPSVLTVNGDYYNYDCSGVVMAAWDKAGIGILKNMCYEKGDNGVKAVHNYLQSKNKLFKTSPRVLPGDLVFFNNTYDKNGNKKQDDPLTHIGLVISVEKDGTILFLNKTSRGITEECLNLSFPSEHKFNAKTENSFLRKKQIGESPSTKHLAGELFETFGTF